MGLYTHTHTHTHTHTDILLKNKIMSVACKRFVTSLIFCAPNLIRDGWIKANSMLWQFVLRKYGVSFLCAISRKIYIPNFILAEEKKKNGTKQTYVVDAGQRTETLYRFI